MSTTDRLGKRGMPLYARMCAFLHWTSGTAREVSENLGVKLGGCARTLRVLNKYGTIHVTAWRQEVWRGLPSAVYAFGPSKDCPPPLTKKGKPSLRLESYEINKVSIEVLTFSNIVETLREGADFHTLRESSGVHKAALHPLLKQMRELRLIHICEWHRNPFGNPTPMLKIGARLDHRRINAERPKPIGKDVEKIAARYERRRYQRVLRRTAGALRGNPGRDMIGSPINHHAS